MDADHSFYVGILQRRAVVVRIAIWAFIVLAAATMLGAYLEASGAVDIDTGEDPLTFLVAIAYLGYFAAFVASVIAISMWIHRAHANLVDGGVGDLQFTPAMSVGWFFVPVANLFMPFQAMRELWKASLWDSGPYDTATPPQVGWWWGTWLSGNILSSIGARMLTALNPEVGTVIDVVSTALLVASAWLLLRIVNEVTAAQSGGRLTAGVFA